MPNVESRPYQRGEAAFIPVAEADPFGFWIVEMEKDGRGLTSYTVDGALVAVTGYHLQWAGVAYAFALVNRELAQGVGRELAASVKARIAQLMARDQLHRVQATSHPDDRASQVFLRATGYRLESTMRCAAPDGGDLLMFAITRSPNP